MCTNQALVDILMESAEYATQHTIEIGENRHGASWWTYTLAKFFEANPAVVSVIYPCILRDIPGLPAGEVEFFRDRRAALRMVH